MIDEKVLLANIKEMFIKTPGQAWKAEAYNDALIDVMREIEVLKEMAGSLL